MTCLFMVVLTIAADLAGSSFPPAWLPADTKFYRDLLQKRRCTKEDGVRIALAFVERGDKERKPEERLARAKELGLLPEDWEIGTDEELPADLFAFLVCRSLDLKGGLTAGIFGLGPRSAYRECVNLRLMRANGQSRGLSGREVLSIMARVEEFRKRREGTEP